MKNHESLKENNLRYHQISKFTFYKYYLNNFRILYAQNTKKNKLIDFPTHFKRKLHIYSFSIVSTASSIFSFLSEFSNSILCFYSISSHISSAFIMTCGLQLPLHRSIFFFIYCFSFAVKIAFVKFSYNFFSYSALPTN